MGSIPSASIPSERRFSLLFDGDPEPILCTAQDWLEANRDLEPEEIAEVAALHVGESVFFGGGAAHASTLTRVEGAPLARILGSVHPYRIYCAKGDHIYQYARQRCVLQHAPGACLDVCASVDYCHLHSPEAERHAAVRA